MAGKVGRPRGFNASKGLNVEMPNVMITKEQDKAYRDAVAATGGPISEWVRGALDAAVERLESQ